MVNFGAHEFTKLRERGGRAALACLFMRDALINTAAIKLFELKCAFLGPAVAVSTARRCMHVNSKNENKHVDGKFVSILCMIRVVSAGVELTQILSNTDFLKNCGKFV